MRGRVGLAAAAVGIGAIDAILFKLFEWVVNNGQQWIWNDVFHTDDHRWAVVPLAAALGIALSGIILLLRQPRMVKPHTDPLEQDPNEPPPTLTSIGIILLVGVCCLLAGASLGPEAALVASTGAIGLWVGNRAGGGSVAQVLRLASVGALLVAFFGSYLLALLPLLILLQKKQLTVDAAIPIVLASASAFGTLWLIDHGTTGYGSIPAGGHLTASDWVVALVIGFAAALLGWLLHQGIALLHVVALRVDGRLAWPVAAALFGAVIGLCYWAGGQSVEFSGSKGTRLLLEHQPAYAVGALVVIVVAKLLATAWSLASGYRGGLVFPSVFLGVALALIAENLVTSTGTPVMIGAIAGIFAAMAGPIVAFIFIASLLPFSQIGIALVGILGAAAGTRLCKKLPAYAQETPPGGRGSTST